MAGRISAARRPGILLSSRDLHLLRYCAEQYGLRADQAQTLLGVSERSFRRVAAKLIGAGLLIRERPLLGAPWFSPSRQGLSACGSPYGPWQLRLGQLPHTAAVNDVRLHVEAAAPGCRWICERELSLLREDGEHLPDGVVEIDGRQIAIEVELTVKAQGRLERILEELDCRYEDVIYYCSAPVLLRLQKLADSGRFESLSVRALPNAEVNR